jgi:PAS domain S-box-containing protein
LLDPLDHPLILDALEDPVSVLQPDGRIAYVNPAAARLLGRPVAELQGVSIWELYPAAVRSRFFESFSRALAAQEEQRLQLHWVTPNTWLDFRFLPCRTGITVLSRNVTGERRLHDALAENEERLRVAQQAAGVGTWNWCQLTGKVAWSEGIWRMIGLEPGSIEPSAEAWNASIHPDDRERVCRRSGEVVAGGEIYEEEFRIVQPDGGCIWIVCLGRVIRDAEGRAIRFLGINLDITRRKEAEQRLAESEARYRFITEALPQVIWVTGPDGRLLECNRHWYELTGLTDAEMQEGAKIEQVIHPEDLEQIGAKWPAHLAHGEEYQFEYRIRRAADGAYRWHFGRAMPFRGADGSVARWLGTAFDIQQLKDAAETVQRSEELHRAFIEQAGEGFWLTDAHGRCLEVNHAACEMLGYAREELLGFPVRDLFHPGDQPGRAEDLRQVQSGQTVRAERRIRRKDGSYALLEGMARSFQGNTIVFFHDVTEERAAHEALVESEQALREAQRVARLGTWWLDLQHGDSWWSEELYRLCALDPRVTPSLQALQRVLDPQDWPKTEALIAGARERGEGFQNLELRVVRPDGSRRWLLVQGEVERDAERRPARLIGSCLDITERKLLEAQLEERARALAAEGRRKDEFLAMLAHELRNPLAPVTTAVHILKLRGDDPALAARQREIIERNTQHLARLVDDLLEVSRINRGKIDLRKERVALRELVQQAVTSVQSAAQARRHELTVSVLPEEVYLYADPVRIVQILVNLLNNAVKYTDEGGRIQFLVSREGHEVALRVRDNGRGIEPELLPRVFDVFVQGERTLARSEGGLGLGLTLSRTLAELHGGTVTAASPGLHQGSEFMVRLPVEGELVNP